MYEARKNFYSPIPTVYPRCLRICKYHKCLGWFSFTLCHFNLLPAPPDGHDDRKEAEVRSRRRRRKRINKDEILLYELSNSHSTSPYNATFFFWQPRTVSDVVTTTDNTTVLPATNKLDQHLESAEEGIVRTSASSFDVDALVLDLTIQTSHNEEHGHGGISLSPTNKQPSTPHTWSNWVGNQQASPTAVFYPSTLDELQSIVQQARQCHKKIRCVASAFSMSSISKTDGFLVNIKCLSSIYKPVFDEKHNSWTVSIQSGVSIKALDDYLRNQDPPLAMSGNVLLESALYGGIIAIGAVSYNNC